VTADIPLQTALAPLDRLPPEGAATEDILAALRTLWQSAPPARIVEALTARSDPAWPERDRRALALHVTEPWVAAEIAGSGAGVEAFEAIVAAADAAALGEFAPRALELVRAFPEMRHDLPGVVRLLEIADQIEDAHEAEAEALVTLAHDLEDLALAGENGADA
jgi:hypothetical protein